MASKPYLLGLRKHFAHSKAYDSGNWRFKQIEVEGKAPENANAIENGEHLLTTTHVEKALGLLASMFRKKEKREAATRAVMWLKRQMAACGVCDDHSTDCSLKFLTSSLECDAPQIWNAAIQSVNRILVEMQKLRESYDPKWDAELRTDGYESSSEDEDDEPTEVDTPEEKKRKEVLRLSRRENEHDGEKRDRYAEMDEKRELEAEVVDNSDEDEDGEGDAKEEEETDAVIDPEQEEAEAEGEEVEDDDDEEEEEEENEPTTPSSTKRKPEVIQGESPTKRARTT